MHFISDRLEKSHFSNHSRLCSCLNLRPGHNQAQNNITSVTDLDWINICASYFSFSQHNLLRKEHIASEICSCIKILIKRA